MRTSKPLLAGAMSATMLLLASYGTNAQVVDDIIGPPIVLELFDEKVMPGNGCQATIGTQARDLNHFVPYLINTSNTYRAVTCPVVRDNTTNTTGTWSAAVTGYNPGGNVYCSINSYSPLGGFVDLGAAATAVVGNFTLNVDSAGSPLNLSVNDGYYTVYCSLPPNARLYSYRWAERLRTDRNN